MPMMDERLLGGPTRPMYAVVRRTSTQALDPTTDTPIQWDTETADRGGFFDSGSNTRLTAPIAGLYLVSLHVVFAGTGASFGHIKFNNSFAYPTISNVTENARLSSSGAIIFSAGSYVEAVMFTDGDDVTTAWMSIVRLGDF